MISESKYEIQRNNHSRVCAPKNVEKKNNFWNEKNGNEDGNKNEEEYKN
jgi:hypothetical protein